MKVDFRKLILILLGLSTLALPISLLAVGGPGSSLFAQIQAVKDQLNLTTSQEVLWEDAVAKSQASREAMLQTRQQLKQAMQTELAKPEPDLASVAALADSLQPGNLAFRQAARNAWLTLYAGMSSDQKTIVKNTLIAKFQRLQQIHQRLMQKLAPQ